MQYFCISTQGDKTLAENFDKIPFHYSLASDEDELGTYREYKDLVSNYVRSRGTLTPSQHSELTSILEKRLPKGSRIQADYLESKKAEPDITPNWEDALVRIIEVVTAARKTILMSRSYGNPDIVYSFPANATPHSPSTKS